MYLPTTQVIGTYPTQCSCWLCHRKKYHVPELCTCTAGSTHSQIVGTTTYYVLLYVLFNQASAASSTTYISTAYLVDPYLRTYYFVLREIVFLTASFLIIYLEEFSVFYLFMLFLERNFQCILHFVLLVVCSTYFYIVGLVGRDSDSFGISRQMLTYTSRQIPTQVGMQQLVGRNKCEHQSKPDIFSACIFQREIGQEVRP